MANQKLYGECLFIAPFAGDDAAAREVFETVVVPAWEEAGGFLAPDVFNDRLSTDTSALRDLAEARVVFADVTDGDSEALYYLGVREALSQFLTIPLFREALPGQLAEFFGERAISVDDPGAALAAVVKRLADLKHKDDEYLSPIAHAIPSLRVTTRAPTALRGEPQMQLWTVEREGGARGDRQTKIGLMCGDLRQVKGIDVWVNSENTYMEMGRMYDLGVSAIIRHFGANWFNNDELTDDYVQRELMNAVGTMRRPVPDATVFMTGVQGRLARQKVKRVAHVAAVRPAGQPGSGYLPVNDLAACVRNVLDTVAATQSFTTRLRSVLFPLMGTGNARASARVVSSVLISAAVDYMRANPDLPLEYVLFLVYSDVDRDLCRAALESIPGLTADKSPMASQ